MNECYSLETDYISCLSCLAIGLECRVYYCRGCGVDIFRECTDTPPIWWLENNKNEVA